MSFPSDTAATWSVLQQLLDKALALPAADRLIWLERSAEVPDALREPLRRLLEVQAGIDTRAFVATVPRSDTKLTPAAPVLIGDMVGPIACCRSSAMAEWARCGSPSAPMDR